MNGARKKRGWVYRGALAVVVTALVMTILIWISSHQYYFAAGYQLTSEIGVETSVVNGGFSITIHYAHEVTNHFEFDRYLAYPSYYGFHPRFRWDDLGGNGKYGRHCEFPLWALVIVLGILPTLAASIHVYVFLSRILLKNTNEGLCPTCGYDLRGSNHSSSCPECGEGIVGAGKTRG